MIEVFKITHNIYDTTVSPDLSFNKRANTRGNNYKLHNHSFHFISDTAVFLLKRELNSNQVQATSVLAGSVLAVGSVIVGWVSVSWVSAC